MDLNPLFFLFFALILLVVLLFLRRLQPKISAQENHLQLNQAILDNSPTAIYVKDINGRYLLVNKFALDLFKLKENEVLGKTTQEIFPKDFADRELITDKKVLQLGYTLQTEEKLESDNDINVFQTIKSPLRNDKGEIYALCGIALDITREKKVQDQLNNYLEKLEEVTTELMEARIVSEEANKTKNAFLANMSHELRTPLNGVIGNITLLEQTVLNEKQGIYIQRIKTSSAILLELIGHILDFTKIIARELKIDSVACNIRELAQDCYDVFVSKAEEKNLQLTLKMPNEPIPPILSDPLRLKQIILNILGNAVKFTEHGSVSFTIEKIKNEQHTVYLLFKIQDTGIGIAEDKMSHLFEKFWQADISNTRKYGGTGLGLAICKEIIERMGGTITSESVLGKGTTFTFEIPFSVVQEK